MRRSIVTILSLLLSVSLAFGQERPSWKRAESNLMIGGGLFLESGFQSYGNNPGAVLRLSYGLDVRFDEQWSVMPGAGLRLQLGDIRHFMWVGGDPDGMGMADVFIDCRYHLESTGSRIVFGLGPALSYMVSPDTYYIDADPSDPLNGKEKFNRFDLGLHPSVTFLRGKHFQWGIEGSLGLLNAMVQYPAYKRTGSIHLHYLAATIGFRF